MYGVLVVSFPEPFVICLLLPPRQAAYSHFIAAVAAAAVVVVVSIVPFSVHIQIHTRSPTGQGHFSWPGV